VAGWLHTEINVRHRELNPDTVTHLSTNGARRRLTSFIEANALTTTPDQPRMFLNLVYILSTDSQNWHHSPQTTREHCLNLVQWSRAKNLQKRLGSRRNLKSGLRHFVKSVLKDLNLASLFDHTIAWALWFRSAATYPKTYTVNHKKRDILFLTITLANLNRFL